MFHFLHWEQLHPKAQLRSLAPSSCWTSIVLLHLPVVLWLGPDSTRHILRHQGRPCCPRPGHPAASRRGRGGAAPQPRPRDEERRPLLVPSPPSSRSPPAGSSLPAAPLPASPEASPPTWRGRGRGARGSRWGRGQRPRGVGGPRAGASSLNVTGALCSGGGAA